MKLSGGLLCLLGAGLAGGAVALVVRTEKDSENTTKPQVQAVVPPAGEKEPPARSKGDQCPTCGRG